MIGRNLLKNVIALAVVVGLMVVTGASTANAGGLLQRLFAKRCGQTQSTCQPVCKTSCQVATRTCHSKQHACQSARPSCRPAPCAACQQPCGPKRCLTQRPLPPGTPACCCSRRLQSDLKCCRTVHAGNGRVIQLCEEKALARFRYCRGHQPLLSQPSLAEPDGPLKLRSNSQQRSDCICEDPNYGCDPNGGSSAFYECYYGCDEECGGYGGYGM